MQSLKRVRKLARRKLARFRKKKHAEKHDLDKFLEYDLGLAGGTDKENVVLPMCMVLDTARTSWDLCLSVVILFYTFVIPMRLAFGGTVSKPPSAVDFLDTPHSPMGFWFVFDNLMDVLFLTDICLNCCTAYYTSENVLVTNRITIFWGYLKSWFFLDLVASFPLGTILILIGSSGGGLSKANKLIRVLRFAKVTKLLRILKLGRIFNRYKIKLNLTSIFMKVSQCCLVLILSWHYIACAFWGISRDEGFCDWTDDSLLNTSEYYTFGATTDYPNGFTTCLSDWVAWRGLIDQSLSAQYSQSFFWAVMITTGVGRDLAPGSNLEVFFTIAVIVFGVLMDAVIIGTITSAISSIDEIDEKRSKVESINEHLRLNKISVALRFEISDYFDFYFSSGISDIENCQELPKPLRMKLEVTLRKKVILSCPFFSEMKDADELLTLIQGLEPVVAMPGEYLTHQDGNCQKMFIIVDGVVDLFTVIYNPKERWAKLSQALLKTLPAEEETSQDSSLNRLASGTISLIDKLKNENGKSQPNLVKVERCKFGSETHCHFFGEGAFLGVKDEVSARSVHYSELMMLDTSLTRFKTDLGVPLDKESHLFKHNPLKDISVKNPTLFRSIQKHTSKRRKKWLDAKTNSPEIPVRGLRSNMDNYQAIDHYETSSSSSEDDSDVEYEVKHSEVIEDEPGGYHYERTQNEHASWHE